MALATDGPGPSLPVMFTVAWNLGRLRSGEGRFDEAAGYFEVAQQCGAGLRSAELKLMAMEQAGAARLANGDTAEAVALWEAGATVADGLGLKEPRDAMLLRLRDHYAHSPGKVREIDRRLAAAVSGPAPDSA
jgi:hypothetical protein